MDCHQHLHLRKRNSMSVAKPLIRAFFHLFAYSFHKAGALKIVIHK